MYVIRMDVLLVSRSRKPGIQVRPSSGSMITVVRIQRLREEKTNKKTGQAALASNGRYFTPLELIIRAEPHRLYMRSTNKLSSARFDGTYFFASSGT